MKATTISVSIAKPPREVYEFVLQPSNLPHWASGISADAKVRFAARNELGVLDHWVTVAPGVEIYAPMRVVANCAGSELAFTLFRQPDMSDDKFAEDEAWVRRDLERLKQLLEL